MSGNGFKCRKLGESMASRPSSVDEGNFGGGGRAQASDSFWVEGENTYKTGV